MNHLFNQPHHPQVIPVRDVHFQHRKFGVVCPVHSLIAKIFGYFVHAVVAADNKPLQVQFIGNSKIERHVERIMVCDKRARGSAAVEGLQNGRFDFEIAFLVQKFSYGSENQGSFRQDIPNCRIHHKVDIPLPVTQFFVGKGIEYYFISGFVCLFFYDRKWAQRFCEQLQFLRMNRYFSHFCPEDKAPNADNISNIQKTKCVVNIAKVILLQINLYLPF